MVQYFIKWYFSVQQLWILAVLPKFKSHNFGGQIQADIPS